MSRCPSLIENDNPEQQTQQAESRVGSSSPKSHGTESLVESPQSKLLKASHKIRPADPVRSVKGAHIQIPLKAETSQNGAQQSYKFRFIYSICYILPL